MILNYGFHTWRRDKRIFTLILLILTIIINIHIKSSNATSVWPSSVSTSGIISKQQDNFTGFTSVSIYKVISGPVSDDLYYWF